jgi:hypothetical protein
MIRKFLVASSAGVVALAGLATFGVGVASAKTITITHVTSASVTCHITAKVGLVPGLKNNWVKTDHASDPDVAVKNIPNTQFASTTPVSTSAKAKSVSCTGTATGNDGTTTGTATVTGIKLTLTQATPSVDNPPLTVGGSTCAGLLAGTQPGDVAATYKSVIDFKTSGAKLGETIINGSSIAPSGLGFGITGGTISGSFAGGSSSSQANVDGTTIAAITAAAPTSAAPTPTSALCQPTLKIKPASPKKAESVSLKAPKGLKKIGIIDSSTITLTH